MTVQMTKSLTLLGNFTEGSDSTMANPRMAVLEHINNMWHLAHKHLDKFR